MTARAIEVDGRPFALLVEGETGSYIVPPIVLDREGMHVGEHNAEVLRAITLAGKQDPEFKGVWLPVIRDADPGTVAWVDRELARLSDELGVPVLGGEEDGS
jgi:hypothetical protein